MSDENPYAPPEADISVAQDVHSELAGRWARLGAAILDSLIMMVGIFAVIIPLGHWDRALAGQTSVADDMLILFLGIFIHFAVNGYLLATKGQSLGKMLAGIRIVSYHDGSLLPLWKIYAFRQIPAHAVGFIPVVGGILSLVNVLFVFRADKRCVHDLIAGTKVVQADSLSTDT